MISKMLLQKILGSNYKVTQVKVVNSTLIYDDYDSCEINIYELAYKCKEWAREQDYHISTGNRTDGTTRFDVMCAYTDADIEEWDDFFSGIFDTEPEAIFKACEWILKEIHNDN